MRRATLVLALLAAGTAAVARADDSWTADLDGALARARSEGKPVLVFVRAPG